MREIGDVRSLTEVDRVESFRVGYWHMVPMRGRGQRGIFGL
jgi:hypothetical protein